MWPRGQVLGRGRVAGVKLKPTVREVGTFKGIIRIVDSEGVPPLFDIRQVRITFPLHYCSRCFEGVFVYRALQV